MNDGLNIIPWLKEKIEAIEEEEFAPASHTHAQADVNGLSAALAGKADTSTHNGAVDKAGLKY